MFRPEVAIARRQQSLGEIQLDAPRSSRVGMMAAIAMLLLVGVVLVKGEYTSRQRVSGEIVPAAGIIQVVSPLAGTVVQVGVKEGDVVQSGAMVSEISGEQQSVKLGGTQEQTIEKLRQERERLVQELKAQRAVASIESKGGQENHADLRAQRDAIDRQIEIVRKEAESGEQILRRLEPLLGKGYVSVLQVQQQQASVLQVRSRLSELERQRLDADVRVRQAKVGVESMAAQASERYLSLQRQISDLDQQELRAEAQRAQTMRATVSGRIAHVRVHPGQAVGAGETLLTIVPTGSTLHAELKVPSSAIGFVRPGDRVALRYEAFPHQHFGLQWGTVSGISGAALLSNDTSRSQAPSVAAYRVAIDLDREFIDVDGRATPLMPGMAIDADIFQERRRLLDWVFEPAASLLKSARGSRS